MRYITWLERLNRLRVKFVNFIFKYEETAHFWHVTFIIKTWEG